MHLSYFFLHAQNKTDLAWQAGSVKNRPQLTPGRPLLHEQNEEKTYAYVSEYVPEFIDLVLRLRIFPLQDVIVWLQLWEYFLRLFLLLPFLHGQDENVFNIKWDILWSSWRRRRRVLITQLGILVRVAQVV